MPDAKDNAKMTGDTHPPEVEADLPIEEGDWNAPGSAGTTRARGRASERAREGRIGRDIEKAGVLKDNKTGDSSRGAGDSGEGSGGSRG